MCDGMLSDVVRRVWVEWEEYLIVSCLHPPTLQNKPLFPNIQRFAVFQHLLGQPFIVLTTETIPMNQILMPLTDFSLIQDLFNLVFKCTF